MELDLPGEAVRGQEEGLVAGEGVQVGWGERAPELGRVGTAFVPLAGQRFLTK